MYWTNQQDLIRCRNLINPGFQSDNEFFIWLFGGMFIANDRRGMDGAWLDSMFW